jgi:cytochrome c oxidase subunit 2
MADGNGPGRITSSGLAFLGLMVLLIILSLYLFIAQPFWFPTLGSIHGADIDSVFMAVLVVTGIAFVITQGMLGYFVARYGSQGKEKAGYWHDNPKAEFFLLTATAVILVVLVFMGQRVWINIYFADEPQNPVVVHVTGQQFQWHFHYPGADGIFGKTGVNYSNSNPLGLDESDPAGSDDIISTGLMHLPLNRPALVRLRSKDVIHSFFLPYQRVKQDAVPGLAVTINFTPNLAGEFEIACAELCGGQHFAMKAMLTVDPSQEAFDNWQKRALADQRGETIQ